MRLCLNITDGTKQLMQYLKSTSTRSCFSRLYNYFLVKHWNCWKRLLHKLNNAWYFFLNKSLLDHQANLIWLSLCQQFPGSLDNFFCNTLNLRYRLLKMNSFLYRWNYYLAFIDLILPSFSHICIHANLAILATLWVFYWSPWVSFGHLGGLVAF